MKKTDLTRRALLAALACAIAVPSVAVAQDPRASQVQIMSRGREARNHLPDGPQQQQRDAEFASGDPLRQSAWLYGQAHELE